MKKHLFYLESSIEEICDQSGIIREEAIQCIKHYFESNFTEEERLEMLLRGQTHANNDISTDDIFDR